MSITKLYLSLHLYVNRLNLNTISYNYFLIRLHFTLVTSSHLKDKLLNDIKTSSDRPFKEHQFPDPRVPCSAHDLQWMHVSLVINKSA